MPESPAWLLLVHHLPARPTRLRVRVWRQLQRLGAVAVKNSVYVLPWSERKHEDFTWLRQEIQAGGGEAAVFRANSVEGATDREIIAAFRVERDTAYERLTADLEALGGRLDRGRGGAPLSGTELDALNTEVEAMQTEFNTIVEIDYFKAPGRARADSALARCRGLLRTARGTGGDTAAMKGPRPPMRDRSRYQGRLWVTRPRPHIDRCASAWLIRRFIDRRPRFGFVAEGGNLRGGISFDMTGAEFTHRGEDCTMETLMKEFGLEGDAGLRAIAEIVHDIDLKDSKFGRSEAGGVSAVLRGLSEGVRNDRQLLRMTEPVFDGLYASLSSRRLRAEKHVPRKRK